MVFSSPIELSSDPHSDLITVAGMGFAFSSAASWAAYSIIISFARSKKNEKFCQKLFEGSADEVGVANAVIDQVKKEVHTSNNGDGKGSSTTITYHASYHYTAHGKDGKTYDCKVSARMVPIEVYNQGVGACLKVMYLLEAPGAVRLELVADNALQHTCPWFCAYIGLCCIFLFLSVFVMVGCVMGLLATRTPFGCLIGVVPFVAAIGLGQWHAHQIQSGKMSEFGVSKDVTVAIADGIASTDLGQALLSGA